MTATAPRRPIHQQNRSCKCSHPYAHLIYDDPYVFQVRGERARSAHYRPCDACLKEADRQRALTANIKYEQRCSRLPPRPVYPRDSNRPKTTPSDNCTWDNFMKRKSKYGSYTLLFLIAIDAYNVPCIMFIKQFKHRMLHAIWLVITSTLTIVHHSLTMADIIKINSLATNERLIH